MGHDRLIAETERGTERYNVLLSCTKNIDEHKSFYGFQDEGNEVDLILAHSAMFSTP